MQLFCGAIRWIREFYAVSCPRHANEASDANNFFFFIEKTSYKKVMGRFRKPMAGDVCFTRLCLSDRGENVRQRNSTSAPSPASFFPPLPLRKIGDNIKSSSPRDPKTSLERLLSKGAFSRWRRSGPHVDFCLFHSCGCDPWVVENSVAEQAG